MFQKIFAFDFDKNKILTSNILKNIRLHYADIRNYFHDVFWNRTSAINNATINIWHNGINPNQLNFIIDQTTNLVKDFELIIDSMTIPANYHKKVDVRIIKKEPNWKDLEKLSPEQREQTIKDYIHYLMYKITIQYNNKDLQKKLVAHVDEVKNNITEIIKQCNDYIAECMKIYDRIISTTNRLVFQPGFLGSYNYDLPSSVRIRMYSYIRSIWIYLNDGIIKTFTKFMDIYFLRRFLDKDYITNVIAYTGAYHTSVYVYILIKEFGFKITHASYSKIADMDQLNSEILNLDFSDDVSEFLYPPIITQCSDISNFPKNFD